MRKRTKIICTMGPATDNEAVLGALMDHGMDVARFNFSHGDHEEQHNRFELLKKVREAKNLPIAALLDTKGPEIRTGLLKDGLKNVTLTAGQESRRRDHHTEANPLGVGALIRISGNGLGE